jgi:hypothetical protein
VSDSVGQGASPRRGGPSVRLIVALLVVVCLGAAVAWWLRPPAVRPTPPAAPAAKAPAPSPPPPVTPAPAAARPAPKPARPSGKAEPEPPVATPAKPFLRVSSDVDGAHVFVDRRYVGNTPLDTSEVTAGRHQVNVSAEGYDPVSEAVDVAETGATNVRVSLKTVRLDASVAVVHKHAMGSCEGSLGADPAGIRYETSNAADAFAMPLSDLEVFTVDYAQKILKVKKRGGRTWNFTTKAPSADALLSFQHDVDRARQKLAAAR